MLMRVCLGSGFNSHRQHWRGRSQGACAVGAGVWVGWTVWTRGSQLCGNKEARSRSLSVGSRSNTSLR